MGITAQQARYAISVGWEKDSLLWLNKELQERNLSAQLIIPNWAYIVDNSFFIYRSYGPGDIRRVFCDDYRIVDALCYTDGSATTKDKPAGIGVAVYRSGFQPLFIAENIGLGTNNVAELTAIWRALKAVPKLSATVRIYSDSEYAIGSLTKDWNPTANVELIKDIRDDLRERKDHGGTVLIEHVDGHNGNEGNEIADQLANIGRKLVRRVSI